MEEISFGDEVIILQVRRDQDKTIPLGSIRGACENFSKCLKFPLELRSESGLRRSMLLLPGNNKDALRMQQCLQLQRSKTLADY